MENSTRMIFWREVADYLIPGERGAEYNSTGAYVADQSLDKLAVILLSDIAKSLRALRCPNFVAIPEELREQNRNTAAIIKILEGPRRKTKKPTRRKNR